MKLKLDKIVLKKLISKYLEEKILKRSKTFYLDKIILVKE